MILKKGLSGKDKAEALTRELSSLKSQREPFEAGWEEAQRFVSSVVLSFTDSEDDSDKKYQIPRRITSRPASFLNTLVSGICGYSINPNILWQKLGLEDDDLETQYGVKDWEEKADGACYKEYNHSNLYSQIPSFIESAATVGHAVMLIDEDAIQQKARYTTMNTREMYLDTNEYDEVDTVFREFYMTMENAAAYFGLENLSDETKIEWEIEESRSKPIRLLHAVYKNKENDGANILSRAFMYASVFVDCEHNHIIRESGYNDFPYAVFFWKRTMGKKYGIGPAQMAVNDIRLSFKLEESRLGVAQLAAQPPMNVPRKLQGQEQLVPDGRNYYHDAGDVISPIAIGANYPITLEITRDQEERIKDWFHVGFFLMLQQLTRTMTATEVVELQGEKAAVLSTMVNNLNSALQKVVQRTVDILFRQGKMPELPAALRSRKSSMKVDFLGVLAQAQKKAHQTSGIMQSIQIMGALAQLAGAVPQIAEAFDYVDIPVLLKSGFESGNVSQLVIREEDDVQKIRQARAEAQAQAAQQQMALQQQQAVMQNFNKLNEPVNPESALAQMGAMGA
ncbi:head-to-tail joining protein [Spirochaetia bacterium]|nr:head-to-tail joining protein [Spirochaetia bacterium]